MQILISLAVLAPQAAEASGTVDVVLETSMGNIEIELNTEKAPQSAGSFLKILDAGLYDKTAFYRVVRPDNDNGDPAITVIQGGLDLTAPLPDGVAEIPVTRAPSLVRNLIRLLSPRARTEIRTARAMSTTRIR